MAQERSFREFPSTPESLHSLSESAQVVRHEYEVAEAESFAATAAETPALSIHGAVSRALAERVAGEGVEAFAFGESAFEGAGNVVAVGVGRTEVSAHAVSAEPGVAAVNVYLVEPMSEERVRRVLADEMGAEAALDEAVPIQVRVSGEIVAYSHTFRIRPTPGGVSVGHFRITAGTLGCLAQGRSGERAERLLILSNNHVLAASNAGTFGDPILQPGLADGGTLPGDQIAALERFIPIDFSGAANLVDCATGWTNPSLVRPELLRLQNGMRHLFRIVARTEPCHTDLAVGKSGRTTQLTRGHVVDCTATVKVRYGSRTALFRDQIAVQGVVGEFSQPGDSGSVIWTWDEERRPVGLLFAGGRGITFANPIDRVLDDLDIDLVT